MSRTVQEALHMAQWAAHDSYEGVYLVSYMDRNHAGDFVFRVKLHSATGPTYFVEVPESGHTVRVGSRAQHHEVMVPVGGKRRRSAGDASMDDSYTYTSGPLPSWRRGCARWGCSVSSVTVADDFALLKQLTAILDERRIPFRIAPKSPVAGTVVFIVAKKHWKRAVKAKIRAEEKLLKRRKRERPFSGGKRRHSGAAGLIAAASALRDAWKR